MSTHGMTFIDQAEWIFARCECGWESPPMPGHEDAADSYGDHRAEVATNETLIALGDEEPS